MSKLIGDVKTNPKIKIAEARGLIWELQDTIDSLRKLDPESPDEPLANNLLNLSEQLNTHVRAIHEEVTSRESKSKPVGLRPFPRIEGIKAETLTM